jgi:GDP-D-mannose dehydratase
LNSSSDADGLGVLHLLEAIRILGMEKKMRLYQASTSKLYGKAQEMPQTEKTVLSAQSICLREFVRLLDCR